MMEAVKIGQLDLVGSLITAGGRLDIQVRSVVHFFNYCNESVTSLLTKSKTATWRAGLRDLHYSSLLSIVQEVVKPAGRKHTRGIRLNARRSTMSHFANKELVSTDDPEIDYQPLLQRKYLSLRPRRTSTATPFSIGRREKYLLHSCGKFYSWLVDTGPLLRT